MNPIKPPLKHCIYCDKRQMNHKFTQCWTEGKCFDCYKNGPLPYPKGEAPPGALKTNPVDHYFHPMALRMAHRGEPY